MAMTIVVITNKQLQITPARGHMIVHIRSPGHPVTIQFTVLYFGRDEFSYRAFEKLYNVKGRSFCFVLAPMFT
jgi:hypothetical protein